MNNQSNTVTSPQKMRQGGWLPHHHKHVAAWLGAHHEKTQKNNKPLQPVMEKFQRLVDSDPLVRMALNKMIAQVPSWYRNYHTADCRNVYLQSVEQMLSLINEVLTQAPEFNDTELVGCPINAILDWCMFTPAGCTAFANPEINAMLREVLDTWSQFLSSEESLYVFNKGPNGWMCDAAKARLNMGDYQYKPHEEHWGFTSWNDFFTRKLRDGARKIDAPDNDKVVVSACDSTVYNLVTEVKLQDTFWIKAQPYSIRDMLANDEDAGLFDNGAVYQAFLSAFNYHRWNSPVTGTVKKIHYQPGTYYSEAGSEGADPGGPDRSQGYISHVATRAMIYIEADDDAIGLMCVMFIGMAEISSCKFERGIKPGARVKKGQGLGYFQFGGSTYCMLFRPGAIKEFHVFKGAEMKMGQEIALAN